MQCCCVALSPILPPEAEQWLKVADKYRTGDLPASELLAARFEAWRQLGPNSCDFSSRQVNGVRAVLFLLFPDDHQDFKDVHFLISEFTSFCTEAGMAVEDQLRCLMAAYDVPSA